jgi:hypothetical protein
MLRFRDLGRKIFRILIRDASMRRMTVTAIVLLAAGPASFAAERLRFWNLTKVTIAELYLAPVGTAEWGPNQCLNDPDKSVDSDERLTITGVEAGRYDAKLVDKKGRACIVPNVEVKSGRPYAFSISDSDLTNCKQ